MPEPPHAFRDPELLELALTHASTSGERNNERLEFLGDAVLDLVVAEDLFRLHPGLSEGQLTELKAWVVSRRVLARAARRLDLVSSARMGNGMRGRALPGSVEANLYEAVLGAVYLDGGYDAARAFVGRTLSGPLERVRLRQPAPNPKQALQTLCQKDRGEPPTYTTLARRGSDHARAFQVAAEASGRRFPSAWGRTVKEAERWAAYEALLVLSAEAPA